MKTMQYFIINEAELPLTNDDSTLVFSTQEKANAFLLKARADGFTDNVRVCGWIYFKGDNEKIVEDREYEDCI